jgi:hypothetical protein
MKWLNLVTAILADEKTRHKLWHNDAGPQGLRGLFQVIREHFRQLTLYNPLALVAGIVFAGSLFYPWWVAKVYDSYYTINAYAFILRHDLPPEGLDFVIETPVVAVAFLLFLLAGYVILAFWGSTMEGKKGRIYLIVTGLCMLLYTAGFLGALLFAMHRINQPLTGTSSIIYTVEVDIFMSFSRAYFVAIGAGILCMVSAFIHGLFNIQLTDS